MFHQVLRYFVQKTDILYRKRKDRAAAASGRDVHSIAVALGATYYYCCFYNTEKHTDVSTLCFYVFPFYRIMVPEKASSFNIHPERTCSDCCFYCRQKFGLFDTPLHISQMKSLDIQKFAMEFSNCSKDACLCDKCYRLVDRNARNRKKESDGEAPVTTEKVRSCFVRNCNKEVCIKKLSIYSMFCWLVLNNANNVLMCINSPNESCIFRGLKRNLSILRNGRIRLELFCF